MPEHQYADRVAAGEALAAPVAQSLAGRGREPLVLALPRGGLPVAAEVARTVRGELDIVVTRKISAPGQPEFGVGAIAEDGPPVFDRRSLGYLGLTEADLVGAVARERDEVTRRIQRYRGGRPITALAGRSIVLVDDGVATGVTARAALRWLRTHRPDWLVMAAPVCSPQAHQMLAAEADAVVCLSTPPDFEAVGRWYVDFAQLRDEEVLDVLAAERSNVRSPNLEWRRR
ncbi:phosphoribosyltransferase [Plantactinospora sp. KBS50]|uniref:phosphoribosyltransferase n=1 Tax=Plantactinospora sp. KBS50 TaxID=2024580 RepID=UPI000BAB050C|nr:phosphoribosyltransferase family protein [Plantactinospora sp. KBS50]ASW57088.1 phosphoribosyltransferase [Plantactinospora sp. KBS50]